jgi:D-alanyl-D-alanine carboxypeptidase
VSGAGRAAEKVIRQPAASLTRREALLLTAAALASAGVRAGPAASGFAAVAADCERMVADRAAPGLSLCVMRDGQPLYSHGFGTANLEDGSPVTPKSIFKIGSITKQFTATAILLLAQEGKLSVEDRLARFLPLFPRANDFTLRQMLNHTSGLGNYTDAGSLNAFLQAARTDYSDPQLIAAMAATSPLMGSEPGTAWSYSNTAYVLLGVVVDIAAGEPYGTFYRRRLFEPLQMQSTAVDDDAQILPNRVAGYTPQAQSASGFANASYISMTYPGGAGSMRSTPEDLCRWHTALLGGRVLQPDSLQQMLTPARLPDGSLPVDKELAKALGDDKPIEYGFGVMTGDFEGQRYVGHGGGINGFVSELRSFPAKRLSIALIVNSDFMGKPENIKRLYAVRDAAARVALSHS